MKIRPTPYSLDPLSPKAKSTQPRKSDGDVKVALSQTARLLLKHSEKEHLDVERVNLLRERLEKNEYVIDEDALAQALIRKELEWKPSNQ